MGKRRDTESGEADKPKATTVDITPATRAELDRIIAKERMPKKDLIEVVLTWFANQDDEIRAIVLDRVPEKWKRPLAQVLLEKMLAETEPKYPPPGESPIAHFGPTGEDITDEVHEATYGKKRKGRRG